MGFASETIQLARSRRVRRFSGLLSSRPGRKEGVAGRTTGPVSSCQLPRGRTRMSSGFAAAWVTIVQARPSKRERSAAASRWAASAAMRSCAVARRKVVVARVFSAALRPERGFVRAASEAGEASSSGSAAARGERESFTGWTLSPPRETTSFSLSFKARGAFKSQIACRGCPGSIDVGRRHSLSSPGSSAPPR